MPNAPLSNESSLQQPSVRKPAHNHLPVLIIIMALAAMGWEVVKGNVPEAAQVQHQAACRWRKVA